MIEIENIFSVGLFPCETIQLTGRAANIPVNEDDCIFICLKLYFGRDLLPSTAKELLEYSKQMHDKAMSKYKKTEQKPFSKSGVSNFII